MTGADLHDADLSNIQAGMSRGWAALVFGGSLVFSVVLGVVIGLSATYLRAMYVSDDVRERMSALYVVSALLVFLVAGMWRGLRFATYNVLPVAAALAIAAALSAVISGSGTGIVALLTVLFLGVSVVIVALAVLVRAIGGAAGKVFFMIVAVGGALAAGKADGGLIGIVIALSTVLMARRSARLETEYPLLARITAAIASHGGTQFRNADLRGANLDHARLYACDFRGANLTGARIDRTAMRLCRVDPPVATAG